MFCHEMTDYTYICAFCSASTSFTAILPGAGSQWRWEEATRQGGSDFTKSTSSYQGITFTFTTTMFSHWISYIWFHACNTVPVFFSFMISLRRGFWRKSVARSATSSQPRRAGRKRKNTLMDWKAGIDRARDQVQIISLSKFDTILIWIIVSKLCQVIYTYTHNRAAQ